MILWGFAQSSCSMFYTHFSLECINETGIFYESINFEYLTTYRKLCFNIAYFRKLKYLGGKSLYIKLVL